MKRAFQEFHPEYFSKEGILDPIIRDVLLNIPEVNDGTIGCPCPFAVDTEHEKALIRDVIHRLSANVEQLLNKIGKEPRSRGP